VLLALQFLVIAKRGNIMRNSKLSVGVSLTIGLFVTFILALLTLVSVFTVQRLTFASTIQSSQAMVNAKAAELGRMIEKLDMQLAFMQGRDWPSEVTPGSSIDYFQKDLPAEIRFVLRASPTGAFQTSLGATGSIADREYFKVVVVKGEKSVVSDAVLSKTDGKPVVVFGRELRRASGESNGLVGVIVSLDYLGAFAQNIKLGKTGYGWIIDQHGLVIAHPDQKTIMVLNVLESADYWLPERAAEFTTPPKA